MRPVLIRKANLLVLAVLLLLPYSISAGETKLTHINIMNTRDQLVVFFNMEDAFHQAVYEATLSGMPTKFSFHITLYRVRDLWIDKKIKAITVDHTVKYDSLKKEFVVQRSWENITHRVKSFNQAQELMSGVHTLNVISLQRLIKAARYQLRIKGELSKTSLPFLLRYILLFKTLWDFETNWYTVDFFY